MEIMKNVSFKIDKAVWDELGVVAKEQGLTRSSYLRMIIIAAINEHKKK